MVTKKACKGDNGNAPACVTEITPANGADSVAVATTINWKAPDGGPAGYKIKIGTSAGAEDIVPERNVGNVTSFDPDADLPPDTTIFVSVIAFNGKGDAVNCTGISFKTATTDTISPIRQPVVPECTTLKNPKHNATDVEVGGTIEWNAAGGNPFSYRVKVATADGEELFSEKDVGIATSIDASFLPKGKEILVTITPYNVDGDAKGCEVQRFTTKAVPPPPVKTPDCVSLKSPAAGATNVSIDPDALLVWDAPTGGNAPDGYKLKVGTKPGLADLFDQDLGNVTSFSRRILMYDKQTFVRIIPYNQFGDAENCDNEVSFTTGPVPEGAPRFVRRSIGDMPDNHPILLSYRKGVAAMKALAPDNPLSWTSQAGIHGRWCGGGSGLRVHGSTNFLPWHRAYLHAFERAIRHFSGDPDFALPYWNWISHDRKVPAHFLDESPDNPLFHARRNSGLRDRQIDVRWVSERIINEILGFTNFGEFTSPNFGGRGLESKPHNNIHGFIGRDMNDPVTAGRDPIFYCHHANVDRIWALWNEKGNPNPNTSNWLNVSFNKHFSDEQGHAITGTTTSDMVSTYPLGYRYDDQKEKPDPTAFNRIPVEFSLVEGLTLTETPATDGTLKQLLEVDFDFSENEALYDSMMQLANTVPTKFKSQIAYLSIKGIKPAPGENMFVSVFINGKNITTETFDESPYYVDSFSFFISGPDAHGGHEGHDGHQGHEGHEEMSYIMDLTPTLRRLKDTPEIQDKKIKVQVMTIPFTDDTPAFTYPSGVFSIELYEIK
ncbi:MAG: hypothetical protein DHS20C18_11070 [Saprospiraceae bacterium]|nr:MAG: hypothetical protein DHS20C18_11070 [Saprospiraceae bacterium]